MQFHAYLQVLLIHAIPPVPLLFAQPMPVTMVIQNLLMGGGENSVWSVQHPPLVKVDGGGGA